MFLPSGASVSVWTFCNSCIWVPPLSSVWKDGSQNHTVIVGKGSNAQKCWKTKDFLGPERFFWRTAGSLTVQDKQGTHEQLLLNKQKKYSGNTSIKNQVCKLLLNSTIIFSCGLYVNIFYVKYLIQVSTK